MMVMQPSPIHAVVILPSSVRYSGTKRKKGKGKGYSRYSTHPLYKNVSKLVKRSGVRGYAARSSTRVICNLITRRESDMNGDVFVGR